MFPVRQVQLPDQSRVVRILVLVVMIRDEVSVPHHHRPLLVPGHQHLVVAHHLEDAPVVSLQHLDDAETAEIIDDD